MVHYTLYRIVYLVDARESDCQFVYSGMVGGKVSSFYAQDVNHALLNVFNSQFGWTFSLYELLYAVLGIFQAMFTVVL